MLGRKMRIETIKKVVCEEYNYENFQDNQPVVSVLCYTYNHADYMRECLNGILMQDVDFAYEVVLFDDASTDGTSDIIREYCEKYPRIMHAFIGTENTYTDPRRPEFDMFLREKYLRGKYVAFCECDDYWSDKNKLKTQVHYLQAHPECSLTLHNAYRLNMQNNTKNLMKEESADQELTALDIIMQNDGMWPTASMVGRKEVFIESSVLYTCYVQDWPMQLYADAKGSIYYFNRPMCVYRYFVEGSWSSRTYGSSLTRTAYVFDMFEMFKRYDVFTDHKYKNIIKARMGVLWSSIVDLLQLPDESFEELYQMISQKQGYNFSYQPYIKSMQEMRNRCKGNLEKSDLPDNKEVVTDFYKNKTVMVFCASTAGKRIFHILENLKVDVAGFVDNDLSKKGKIFEGKTIYSRQDLEKMDLSQYVIQVASLDYDSQICSRLDEIKGCEYISAHHFYGRYFAEEVANEEYKHV